MAVQRVGIPSSGDDDPGVGAVHPELAVLQKALEHDQPHIVARTREWLAADRQTSVVDDQRGVADRAGGRSPLARSGIGIPLEFESESRTTARGRARRWPRAAPPRRTGRRGRAGEERAHAGRVVVSDVGALVGRASWRSRVVVPVRLTRPVSPAANAGPTAIASPGRQAARPAAPASRGPGRPARRALRSGARPAIATRAQTGPRSAGREFFRPARGSAAAEIALEVGQRRREQLQGCRGEAERGRERSDGHATITFKPAARVPGRMDGGLPLESPACTIERRPAAHKTARDGP